MRYVVPRSRAASHAPDLCHANHGPLVACRGALLRAWLPRYVLALAALADGEARLLRIRPTTLHLRPRNPFARDPSVRSDPTSAAERWLRSLEDSTGSVRYGLRFESSPVLASSSSVLAPSLSSSTSSSGLTQRRVAERNVLPDFLVCGYEEALARAKRELKVLMVVLTCEEHDDDLHFKR